MKKLVLLVFVYTMVLFFSCCAPANKNRTGAGNEVFCKTRTGTAIFKLDPYTVSSATVKPVGDARYGIHIVLSDVGRKESQRVNALCPSSILMTVGGRVVREEVIVAPSPIFRREFVWSTFSKEEAYALVETIKLHPGYGIFEGTLTLPSITIDNGKKVLVPSPSPLEGKGNLIWKGTDSKIHSIQVKHVETCTVPGSSGWESIKPCFRISESKKNI